MMSCLLPFALLPLLAAPIDESPAAELRYTGTLNKASQESDGAALKRFSLYCVLSHEPNDGRRLAWFINERGSGGWPWPERFGTISVDAKLNPVAGSAARLLYDYQGNPLAIPVSSPIVALWPALKANARGIAGKEAWEVAEKVTMRGRDCWKVQVSTSFGRKRTLWVDISMPLLVALEERVFVGQGDEHLLTMQLEAFKPLDEGQLNRDTLALPALLKLKAELQRSENEFRPELSEAQLKLVGDVLPQLQKEAADTPFGALVAAIGKDLKAQLLRTDEVSRLAEKYVGKAAPVFALGLTDKSQVAEEAFKGQITVLHFWEYQHEPLVEPYGQVGYLDFLYGRRRKLGAQVYGVAVDGRFGDAQAAPAAVKSVHALRDFMRLSYPIAADDGKLLTRFGDPRKFGAKLPLWVVIDPAGKVAHYHTGYYKIDPDEGLRELDDVLVRLIREQKEEQKEREQK